MIRYFLVGSGLGLGIWLVMRGMFPTPATLTERLTRHGATIVAPTESNALRGWWEQTAIWALRTVKGDLMGSLESDVAVSGRDLQAVAVDKLNTGIGGGAGLCALGLMFGLIGSPVGVAITALTGAAVGYMLPDLQLKKQAAARREEFAEALNAFVRLVAVAISGGGGVNSAMQDATTIGGGWCFEALRQSIAEATLHGESPWSGFDALGRRFGSIPLIELAGALSLAGTSGARVTETLSARAEAGRERELAEALTLAEKRGESMNVPVAAMALGWMAFIAYPAIAGLVGT